MNFYLDTEFHEGFHKPLFGKRRHFIDLISIGITDDLGGSFYEISNEFDLYEVWNKWQLKNGVKEYWLRENVLRPVFKDLKYRAYLVNDIGHEFTYKDLKYLLKEYGYTNKVIATKMVDWIYMQQSSYVKDTCSNTIEYIAIQFYAYYADYDWVLFCSLFGTMMDLPNVFPMYCRDLKQMLDMRLESMDMTYKETMISNFKEKRNELTAPASLEDKLFWAKNRPKYPKQTNEHNALADAKWNKELFTFIEYLKFYHE